MKATVQQRYRQTDRRHEPSAILHRIDVTGTTKMHCKIVGLFEY